MKGLLLNHAYSRSQNGNVTPVLKQLMKKPIDRIRTIIRKRPLITDTQTITLDW